MASPSWATAQLKFFRSMLDKTIALAQNCKSLVYFAFKAYKLKYFFQ